jgi:molybdenum-dependent DNA-binding transcriptional regulator ModE
MKPVISNAVVQAMRHDFDHGLMSVAQVAEKHGVNYHTAWDIVQRRSRQGTEGA